MAPPIASSASLLFNYFIPKGFSEQLFLKPKGSYKKDEMLFPVSYCSHLYKPIPFLLCTSSSFPLARNGLFPAAAPYTNAARDLGQFSARFGTLFFAFFPCWHSIYKARRNFSPGFLCCSVPRAVVIRYTTFGFPVQGQAHIPRSQIQRAKNPCSASLHGQCKVFRILWALKR